MSLNLVLRTTTATIVAATKLLSRLSVAAFSGMFLKIAI
jgi:hypothetical protein